MSERVRTVSADVRWDLALLLAVPLVGYPLISGLPVLVGLESRVVTVPYRALVLGLSLWSLARSWRLRTFYAGGLWWPLAIFWTLYVARMLSDTLIAPVPLGFPPSEYFLYGLGTCLIPMLPLFAGSSAATLRRALQVTVAAGTIACLAITYTGLQVLLSGDLSGIAAGRFELHTLNPISVGHVGASVATLALFQLRSPALRGGRLAVPLLAGAAVTGLVTAAVAASKSPLLGLAVSVLLMLYLEWREGRRVRAVVGAVVAPVLGYQGARYVEQELGFGVISRFLAAVNDPGDDSTSERLLMLDGAREQFLANPFLGSSLDERTTLIYPHNLVIESFMAVGVVGGVMFLIFLIGGLGRSLQLLRRRPDASWLTLMAMQYSVNAMFSGAIWGATAMWAMLAASITAAAYARPVASTDFTPSPAPAAARTLEQPA